MVVVNGLVGTQCAGGEPLSGNRKANCRVRCMGTTLWHGAHRLEDAA